MNRSVQIRGNIVKKKIKIVVGIIAVGVTMVLGFILGIQEKPFNINQEDVDGIKIFFEDIDEDTGETTYYSLEINGSNKNEFISKLNSMRGSYISVEWQGYKFQDEEVEMDITLNYISSQSEGFYIKKNGYVLINEACDCYKISNREWKKFYNYVKNLCLSDKSCVIKHDLEEFWEDTD